MTVNSRKHMTIKAKQIIGLVMLLSVVSIYLTRCNGNSFHVQEIGKRHEFNVRQTHLHLSIDAPVLVEITGELDGEAVVFIPNGPQDSTGLPKWKDHYSVRLSKGRLSKKIYAEMDGDFPLIYQPVTAKEGSVVIKTSY